MKKWIWMGLIGLCAVFVRAEITVTNLVVAQREGTKLVDISYDVSSTQTNAVTVSLSVSNGTSAVACPAVTGDVGAGVATGTGKSMVWDMAADWNGNISSNLVFGLTISDDPPPPVGMVLIPAGTNSGTDPDLGAYSLTVSAFYMDETEVTKVQWDTVYNWAVANGYSFDHAGSGKASTHPVQTVSWYDCVKWCNARSEMQGKTPCYTVGGSVYKTGQSSPTTDFNANGYRLPTNTEWEYASRGGLSGKRFPWGDTVNHDNANYRANGSAYSYDTSPYTSYTFHPDYDDGATPYTSPVGSFATNGYGLYDMSGNVWEWCNDAWGSSLFIRGGCWYYYANIARCGFASWFPPGIVYGYLGFRSVCR